MHRFLVSLVSRATLTGSIRPYAPNPFDLAPLDVSTRRYDDGDDERAPVQLGEPSRSTWGAIERSAPGLARTERAGPSPRSGGAERPQPPAVGSAGSPHSRTEERPDPAPSHVEGMGPSADRSGRDDSSPVTAQAASDERAGGVPPPLVVEHRHRPPPVVAAHADEPPPPGPAAVPASQVVVPVTSPVPPPAPSKADPLPRVRVTIGRVEVRAAFPPPPRPRQPKKRGPAMTLDDYLERRERPS